MNFFVYILVYPLLYFFSILPHRLFYFVSDFIYIIVYYIIGYRKKTVRENIALALPHLNVKEQLDIEKKSYKHLCDMFLEMTKTLTISQKAMEKRFKITNLDTYLELEKKGKSIALMCAHYATYEWVISMNYYINHKGYGIYKKIKNPYFDTLVKKIRSRFKAELITTKETITTIEQNSRKNVLSIYGFASDQTPRANAAYHWVNFLGHEVPAHTGAEMLSKRFNMNVVFLKVKKVKRGYYEATLELLSDDVKSVPNYEITDTFFNRVEKQIMEAPEYYLWTHKRWKFKR